MKTLQQFVAALSAALLLVGCPGSLERTPENEERFGNPDMPPAMCRSQLNVQTAIFAQTCGSATCHGNEGTQQGAGLVLVASPDLTDAEIGNLMVNKPAALQAAGISSETCPDRILIDPSTPDDSFLLEKVNGLPREGCGDLMPRANTLNGEQFLCLRKWVFDVAKAARGGDAGVPDATINMDGGVEDAPVVGEDMAVPDATADADPAMMVDCSVFDGDPRYDNCGRDDDANTCKVGLEMGADDFQCKQLCESQGMVCTASFANIDAEMCSVDMTMPLNCDETVIHMSDHCVCGPA